MPTYHIALSSGQPNGLYANGHREDTAILHMRRDIDFLPCDIIAYLGTRVTTKRKARANRRHLLTWINGYLGRTYKRLVIE